MKLRFTGRRMVDLWSLPEMAGMTNYLNGRRAWRDADGHPSRAGEGDDDTDDDDEGDPDDDDDSGDGQGDDDTDGKKSKGSKPDEDDETVEKWRFDRVEARMKAADRRASELQKELDRLKSEGVKDEDVKRQLAEVQASAEKSQSLVSDLRVKVAFLSNPVGGIVWQDPADALKFIDLTDVDISDDGKVDGRALRSAVKRLAKEKPYLLKSKPAARKSSTAGDDDDDSASGGSSGGGSASGRVVNKRRGQAPAKTTEADLRKKYPAAFR